MLEINRFGSLIDFFYTCMFILCSVAPNLWHSLYGTAVILTTNVTLKDTTNDHYKSKNRSWDAASYKLIGMYSG